MTQQDAELIKKYAIGAIQKLSSIFQVLPHLQPDEQENVKSGIGRSIGFIDENILYPIYDKFPNLSDVE